MIKLFITDLDGCISHPFESPNWGAISRIKELVDLSSSDEAIPPMTICSGRPLPYVEAVSQWIGMKQPMIFESGGGIYDMQTNTLTWNPSFDETREAELNAIKAHLTENYIRKIPNTIPEFAKRTDIGLINPDPAAINGIYESINEYVENNFPNFEVHYTDVSINVISKSTNKGAGISHLCEMLNLKLDEIAYIGDTSGDIPALEIVGKSFAPKNAKEYVRQICEFPLEKETTEAVLEAYEWVIDYNRALLK